MYEITIKKISNKTFNDKTYEKVADKGNERDGGAVYAYVPYENVKEVSEELYSQRLSNLQDEANWLGTVIKAVNQMG